MWAGDEIQSPQKLLGDLLSKGGGPSAGNLSGLETVISNAEKIPLKAWDRKGVILHWNAGCEQLYGYSASEVIGRRFQEIVLSEGFREEFEKALESIFAADSGGSVSGVWKVRTRDGAERAVYIVMFTVSAGAAAGQVFSMGVDITEHKQAESARRKKQEQYKSLLESISVGIGEIDTSGVITFANRSLHRIFGYDEEQLQGREIFDLMPFGSEQQELRKYISQIVKDQFLPIPYQGRGLKQDGRVIDIQMNWDYKHDQAGNLSGFIAIIRDVSEQKKAQRRRIESENRFKALVSHIPGVVYRSYCDRDWTVRFVNDAMKDISGYPAGDFVGSRVRSYASIIHPADRAMVERVVLAAVGQKRPFDVEYRIMHACGSLRWIHDKGQGVFGAKDKLLYLDGVVFDITARKENESRQKLAEVILRCLNQNKLDLKVIGDVLGLLKKHTGFEVVGIRLCDEIARSYFKARDGVKRLGNLPGGVFICLNGELDYSNSVLDRFCGDVLSGRVVEDAPYFSKWGSFWVNSISSFVEQIDSGVDFSVGRDRFYESAALIPLRCDNRVVGVLQIVDSRRGLFTVGGIRFLERIGGKIGMALARIRDEDQIESLARFPYENPFPVLRIGADGVILHANPAGLSLLNKWGFGVGDPSPDKWREFVSEAIRAGSRKEMEITYDKRIFLFIAAPVSESGYANIYGHDITERKQAENEMIRLNEELENRVIERTSRLITAHKLLLQEIDERKAIEKELLEISEREKRLVGQELHDSIGQQLAGVSLMAKVLEQRLSDKQPDEASSAAAISKIINEAMDHARGLARGLHPVDLSADTFQGALKELAANTQRLFGVRCNCKLDREVMVGDTTTAVHLYRISQEAITNAVKHGKSNNIEIELARRNKKSVLKITNDGEDFPEVMEKKSGMGLQIMDYRAEMIDGSLDVRRRQGGGTIVKCMFSSR